MSHRFLMVAAAIGLLATTAAPCPAQTIYPNTNMYDDYGQGYYGGFGRRTNGLFPGSYNAAGNHPYVYTPNSSSMFPRYYPYGYGGTPNNGGYGYYPRPYDAPVYTPNFVPAYNPYGYSPYSYNPYNGW